MWVYIFTNGYTTYYGFTSTIYTQLDMPRQFNSAGELIWYLAMNHFLTVPLAMYMLCTAAELTEFLWSVTK